MTEPAADPERQIAPRRWRWWIACLTLVLVAAGAAVWLRQSGTSPPLWPTSVVIVPQPGETPALPVTGVFIEPGDGRAPILDEIQGARHSIDLEVYLVSDDAILRSLEEAPRRGVAVRVILEEQPFGGGGGQEAVVARLASAGIAVRWGNPVFRFSQVGAAPGEPSSEARIADTTWQVCR
jgi:phosphatidylserine/phosphatidylglycerophosphate/cardiolipin synthase-like enzyme